MYNFNHSKYFSEVRVELLELIPEKNRHGNILEIGAAGCDTLLYAKKHGFANKIFGVELFKLQNSNQDDPMLDGFKIQNIEEYNLEYDLDFFDVILVADVFEHLVDPYKTLDYIQKFLKKDGVIISSIPNFCYFEVMKKVFIGRDFGYTDSGILDRTHLRFFCEKNIIDFFENSKLNISIITSSFEKENKGKKYLLNKLVFGKLTDFFIFQYFIVANKK